MDKEGSHLLSRDQFDELVELFEFFGSDSYISVESLKPLIACLGG